MGNNNFSNPAEYKTRDIYLSASLKACSIPLIRVESHEGKGFFIFKYSPKIEDIIADYHNGELKIDARTLFNVWKDLKSLAFSVTNNQYEGNKYENSNRNRQA